MTEISAEHVQAAAHVIAIAIRGAGVCIRDGLGFAGGIIAAGYLAAEYYRGKRQEQDTDADV